MTPGDAYAAYAEFIDLSVEFMREVRRRPGPFFKAGMTIDSLARPEPSNVDSVAHDCISVVRAILGCAGPFPSDALGAVREARYRARIIRATEDRLASKT